MGTASRSEAVRAGTKVLLIDCFQHVAHGTLDHLVLERRDPNRPCPSSAFGDVHPSDRLVSIPLRLQPGVQALEIALQVSPVRLLGDSIHPCGRTLANAVIGDLQRGHIHQMRK